MVEVGQETSVDTAGQEQDPDPEAAAQHPRAEELIGHALAVRRVRTDLTLSGGRGPEIALRLLDVEQFFTRELTDLGALALLHERLSGEHIEGRKSLPLQ